MSDAGVAQPAKDLAGLAPPGNKRQHDWIQDAFRCLPLAQLPIFLLPRPSPSPRLQPPRLHFGWPFPETYIIELGKQKNFVTTGSFNVEHQAPIEHVVLKPTEKRIQEIIRRELGVPAASCSPRVLRAFGPFSDYFLSLTNNYIKGDYVPPEEDIAKIAEYFGLEGPPLWYLDAEGYQSWGYYSHKLNDKQHLNMSASVIPTNDLAGLAPPGNKRQHDWIQDAFRCLPLAQLPIFLLPRPFFKPPLQPPRLHFGWPFPETYIIELGKQKNFVTTGSFNVEHREPIEYVVLKPTEKRIQDIIHLELGVLAASCSPLVLRAFGPFSDYFLSLTNNYIQGDYVPPKEDIAKIGEYFGLEGAPLWYLDAEGYQCWGYHTLDKRQHS